jgi:integral membrane protein
MLKSFRVLSLIEGTSLLLLLFAAMPARHYLGISDIVFYAGMTHGMLFLAYAVGSLIVSHQQKWSVGFWLMVFLASVVPFACFILDRRLTEAPPEMVGEAA